jgi:ADP-heptose:LPS heptosyltransferase
VLVINWGLVGDSLLQTPLLRALRRGLPNARIDLVAHARSAALFASNPHLTNVIAHDPKAHRGWRCPRFLPFAWGLRRAGYDLVIDAFGNRRSAWLTSVLGATITVGWDGLHARRYARRAPVTAAHIIDRYLALGVAAGVAGVGPELDLVLRDEWRTWAERCQQTFSSADPLVLINVGAGDPRKRWPAERVGELARTVGGRGLRCVLLWGPGEEALARTAAAISGAAMAPACSLGESAALIARAALLVTPDSGPLHMATALRVPVVGLFSTEHPDRYGPRSGRFALVTAPGCGQPGAQAADITHDQVLAACTGLLAEVGA